MSLTAVELSSDVYMVCMSHALTTEKEEIMGLLLGDIEVLRGRENYCRNLLELMLFFAVSRGVAEASLPTSLV